jgi:hypothetical protein
MIIRQVEYYSLDISASVCTCRCLFAAYQKIPDGIRGSKICRELALLCGIDLDGKKSSQIVRFSFCEFFRFVHLGQVKG